MLPLLLLYLYFKDKQSESYKMRVNQIKRLGTQILVVLLMLTSITSEAKLKEKDFTTSKSITFKVLRNNRVIGKINMSRHDEGSLIHYQTNTKINTKLLFNIRVLCKEKSVFENGLLVYSEIYRKYNDKVKEDKALTYNKITGYSLKTIDGKDCPKIKEVKQNLVTLYFQEPLNIQYVFCDNLLEMAPVKQLDKGIFKVQISGTKYLNFYYTQGECVKVEVVNPLFKVTLISTKS